MVVTYMPTIAFAAESTEANENAKTITAETPEETPEVVADESDVSQADRYNTYVYSSAEI